MPLITHGLINKCIFKIHIMTQDCLFFIQSDFNYHKIILIRQQLNTTPTALIYKPSTLLHVQLVIILQAPPPRSPLLRPVQSRCALGCAPPTRAPPCAQISSCKQVDQLVGVLLSRDGVSACQNDLILPKVSAQHPHSGEETIS